MELPVRLHDKRKIIRFKFRKTDEILSVYVMMSDLTALLIFDTLYFNSENIKFIVFLETRLLN